jgi:signal transduction histidine kinase
MKILPAALAVPLLLVLLTWLSFRAVDPRAERFDRALKALDRFAIAETALDRDVLSARAGMLRNYDPLVREVNALERWLARLRDRASGDPAEMAAIARFAAAVARQEGLTEQFKSDNALLENSLAHFRLISAELSASDHRGGLAPAVSALAAAMLQLTLDTSPAAAGAVAEQLNELAGQRRPPDAVQPVRAVLAHGWLLERLLPVTDGVLRALLAAPSSQELNTLRTMILEREAAARATAQAFRLGLYGTSLLLLGLLVYVGFQLRARVSTLQRRAAFEHVIAGISTRLIGARAHEIDAQIDRALAELAALVDADRAYLVVSDGAARRHRWCRRGLAFPPGWPDRAPALAARFGAAPTGLHIAGIDRLPPAADKDILASAGLRGWTCVATSSEREGFSAILGFDALRRSRDLPAVELGLLRVALDAVANAVGRERLEDERARLERSLQQARRLETVGALASGIAHNFNNIVGAILGHAEMAEAQLASDRQPAGNLREIRRAGERARDLAGQILAFGRRRDAGRRPVSLKGLIAETQSMLGASFSTGIELVVREVPDAAVVSGQPAQLQQVLFNLCHNAAEAMNHDGRIEIETEVLRVTESRLLTHGRLGPGRYARIAVSDAGHGIDEKTLEQIFQPFFTTRAAGNGLGLATVREIVHEHRGAIDVSSRPGAGSRFEVWLPFTVAGAALPNDDPSALRLGSGQTVLVVVDGATEELCIEEEMLAALGYEPVGFTRADAALAACQATPKRFDALVVGHVASAETALELAVALRDCVPDVPILLATALTEEIGADALLAAGISEVVHRPFVAAEMASIFARCLGNQFRTVNYACNAFAER